MNAPERARVLDAEMQLQRAWLELSLRDLSSAARASPWAQLKPLKFGLSLIKHRSLWFALASVVLSLVRRNTHKEKS